MNLNYKDYNIVSSEESINKECFSIVIFNKNNDLLASKTCNINSCQKVIANMYLNLEINQNLKLIAVHNHISNNVSPSLQDWFLTNKIKSICSVLGINFIDHVIWGNGCINYSFKKSLVYNN